MSGWNALKETWLRPDTTPKPNTKPTFDAQEGFDGKRKERVKLWKDVEMDALHVPEKDRDYCSHLLIPFIKCRTDNFPFLYRCGHQKHEYLHCHLEDQQLRIKEWERERRLRLRAKAKALKEAAEEMAD